MGMIQEGTWRAHGQLKSGTHMHCTLQCTDLRSEGSQDVLGWWSQQEGRAVNAGGGGGALWGSGGGRGYKGLESETHGISGFLEASVLMAHTDPGRHGG